MKKILVTGPDGFVGTAVCRELLRHKYCVRGAQWRDIPLSAGCESVVVGNIGAETDWSDALFGVDAVVHLAARVHIMQDRADDPLEEYRKVNVRGTQSFAEAAAKAGVKRFVFLSSVKVNGEFTEQGISKPGNHLSNGLTSKDAISPQKVFKETDQACPVDPYAISKWEAEQVLWKIETRTGMDVTILRSPLTYGPGIKANFLKLIQLIDRGIPLPFGGIHNKRSLMGLTNLVELICCSLKHPAAANNTFLVSDGDDVSTPELVQRIAQALGKNPRLLLMPEWVMKLGGRLTGKSAQVQRLCSSLLIDSSKVRRILNWTPSCTMDEELAQVAKWYRNNFFGFSNK